jgi:hypothetical protein
MNMTFNGKVLDRRAFIGALGLTVAGTLLTVRGLRLSQSSATWHEAGDWHIDDMWGHMPRYAHPIAVEVSHQPVDWSRIDPIDYAWVS